MYELRLERRAAKALRKLSEPPNQELFAPLTRPPSKIRYHKRMDTAAKQLIHSPKLALYVERFEEVLAEEKARREAFYREMNEGDKVEFINGEVVMHSPVKKRHNDCGRRLLTLLTTYVQQRDLGFVGYEKILISLTRNDYEPDLCYFGHEKAEGLTPEQMLFPVPDFIVEILSSSTEDRDRGVKFEDYAAHGVGEYWIVDPVGETVEQYFLNAEAESYELHVKSDSGLLKSRVIEDLELPVRSLFNDGENLRVLRKMLE